MLMTRVSLNSLLFLTVFSTVSLGMEPHGLENPDSYVESNPQAHHAREQEDLINSLLVDSTVNQHLVSRDENNLFAYLSDSAMVNDISPSTSLIWQVGEKLSNEYIKTIIKDYKRLFHMMKSLLFHGDLGPVAVEMVDSYMTKANQKLIKTFFKPASQAPDEFDEENIRSWVEMVNHKISCLISDLFLKEGLYGEVPGLGRINIYRDKPLFSLLIDASIPDYFPGKSLLLKLVNLDGIQKYLTNKLNQMIAQAFVSLYKSTTGQTLKQSASPVVSNQLKAAYQYMTTPVEELSDGIPEKSASQVWKYMQPRLSYYMRLAISEILKPGLEAIIREVGYQKVSRMVPETSDFTLYGISATMGWCVGGWLGIPIAMASYHALKTAAYLSLPVFRERMVKYGDLLITGLSYQIVPYSPEEHSLFYLKEMPHEIYLLALEEDYKLQEKLRVQGFMNALLKDLNNSIWKMLGASCITSIWSQVDKLEENTPTENKEVKSLEKKTKKSFTGLKNRLRAEIALGAIIAKQRQGVRLSSQEQQILNSFINFPSYAVKSQDIKFLMSWYRGVNTLGEKVNEIRQKRKKAEERLVEIYTLYAEQIPNQIACAYRHVQTCGRKTEKKSIGPKDNRFLLGEQDFRASVAHSLFEAIGKFSKGDLEMLKQMLAEENGEFLMDFVMNYVLDHLPYLQNSTNSSRESVSQAPPDPSAYQKVKGTIEHCNNENYENQKNIFSESSFIQTLMEDYASKNHKEYIADHQDELEKLRNSPLCFGLSLNDVIELHMKMDQSKREKYTNLVLPTYKQVLEQAVTALSRGIENSEDNPTPFVKAVIEELEIIKTKISELVKKNQPGITKHYRDLFTDAVDKGMDLDVFLKEKVQKFEREAEEHAFKHPAPLDKYTQSRQEYSAVLTPEVLNRVLAKCSYIARHILQETEWNAYKSFHDQLKTFVTSGDARRDIYAQIIDHVMRRLLKLQIEEIALQNELEQWQQINLENLDQGKEKSNEKINLVSLPHVTQDLSYNDEGKERISDEKNNDQEKIGEDDKGDENGKNQRVNDLNNIDFKPYAQLRIVDKDDFTGFYLSQIVNNLVKDNQIRDVSHLTPEDIGLIHWKIQELKKSRTMDEDGLLFVDNKRNNYLAYLFKFKSKSVGYKQRLFYSYSQVVDEILKKNRARIEKILERNMT